MNKTMKKLLVGLLATRIEFEINYFVDGQFGSETDPQF